MEIGFLQEIKAIIKSLVVSYPHHISIEKLNKDFSDIEGCPIPYGTLGFKNLETFLRSLSDTVTIKGHGSMATVHCITNNKANHILDMVKAQKKTRHSRNSKSTPKNKSYIKFEAASSRPRLGSRTALIWQEREKVNFMSYDITRDSIILKANRIENQTANNKIHSRKKSPSQIIQEKKLPHVEFDRKEHNMKKTFTKSEESKNSKQNTSCSKESFQPIKKNDIEKVEKMHATNVIDLYTTDLNNDIENITSSIIECVNVTTPKYLGSPYKSDVIVDRNVKGFFEHSRRDNYDDEAVPLFAADNLVFRFDFPENTVIFGKEIKPFELPSDVKTGSIIGIFISEIHNPFKFWFHIYNENDHLDILMHSIERFYNSLDCEEFVIPICCHKPGQICAALYNDLWHRAEIVGNPIKNQTKVFFLDYGTVSNVSVDNIKYLASVFATIPAQAVRGCLSHIKPRGLHWTHEATKYFLSIVSELMLYGQIIEMDKQNRIIHMVICNTNGPEITQVNRLMVESKFAQYDEEWMNKRIEKNGLRWHHIREDFPTFEMLEKGEYPSLSEVVDLLNRNIDYERIIDRKMFHYGKMNHHEYASEALKHLPFILLNTNPFKCDIILELNQKIK